MRDAQVAAEIIWAYEHADANFGRWRWVFDGNEFDGCTSYTRTDLHTAAQARIADLEAQIATAHAEGYADGVRNAAGLAAKHAHLPSGNAYENGWLRSASIIEAEILALLPPNNGKGGDAPSDTNFTGDVDGFRMGRG